MVSFLPSDTVHYFSSVAQWCVQATAVLVCCTDVTELHPHVGKEQKLCLTSLSPDWWTIFPHCHRFHRYLSGTSLPLAYITWCFCQAHTSPHIYRDIGTHSHSLPSHSLSDFASGAVALEISGGFMGELFSCIFLSVAKHSLTLNDLISLYEPCVDIII